MNGTYNQYRTYLHSHRCACQLFCVSICCLLCCAIPGMVSLITLNQVAKEWPTAEAVVVGKIDCNVDVYNTHTPPSNETLAPINGTWAPTNETWASANETLVPSNETVSPSNETLISSNETLAPINGTWAPVNETLVPSNETVSPSNETLTRSLTHTLSNETLAPNHVTYENAGASYYIVYNFTTLEGEEVSVQSEQCTNNVPEINSTNTIYYNPDDPREIHEEDDISESLSIAKNMTIVGFSSLAVIAFGFGMYFCIKKDQCARFANPLGRQDSSDNFGLEPQQPVMPITTTFMAGNTAQGSNNNNKITNSGGTGGIVEATAVVANNNNVISITTPAERLAQLDQLKQKHLISEEEYNNKRNEILESV